MATANYIWDFGTDSYMMEKDANGNTTAVYTSEPVEYGRLISQRRGNTTSYYHFDAQGSTRQLTDQAGDVNDAYVYAAFGAIVASSGTTTNGFRYHGEDGYYTDLETGHLYVRRRANDVSLGRWLSCDPLHFDDGINIYIYVRNSPISRADPSGMLVHLGPVLGAICGQGPGKLPGINTKAQCIAACNAHPDLSASQKVICLAICNALTTFGCINLGKFCYKLKLKKNIEVCLALCQSNCAPQYC